MNIFRIYIAKALPIITCLLVSLSGVFAQNLPQADQERFEGEVRRQEAVRSEDEKARRESRREQTSSQQPPVKPTDNVTVKPGGPCFKINNIILSGFEPLNGKPDGYRNLIGTCATAADIGEALNRINVYYQREGYITTRAYVPKQDIADGSLEITIVPGRIEGYVYADGRQADRRIRSAFPTKRDDILFLRDLEQGLDNLNAPRSVSGRFQLIPGEKDGGSFVQIDAKDGVLWHLSIDVNNKGFDTTGVVKTGLTLGLDNVLGLNDQWNVGISSPIFENRSDKYSDTYSLSGDMPFGYWSFGLDIGKSAYFFILEGVNQSYPVEGRSHYGTLSIERLLTRDKTSKIHAYADLKLIRTKTFIDNVEIESQNRRFSIGSLGLRGEDSLGQGKLTWDLGSKFGLDILNAYVLDKSIVDLEFKLLKSRLTYEYPLQGKHLRYKGILAAQYSNDILPGADQFSIGGWSTVRGFHDDSMYGDSGIYLNNTLEWDAYKADNLSLGLTLGFDFSYIQPSNLRSWSQDYLIGLSLGTKITIQNKATLTLEVAHALSRPSETLPNSQPAFESGEVVGFAGFTMEF